MTCTFIFGFAVYASKIGSVQIESELISVIIGLTIGFVSIVLIYSFKAICPAHFNPAITFAAMFFLKIPVIDGLIAILAQLCGVMVAAGVVLGCFAQDRFIKLDIIRSKEASNSVSNGRLICTELFLTGILVFVAFAMIINAFKETELDEKEVEKKGRKPADESCVAPLAIGITYGFLSFCGLSSSGSVFNPALVWAPALFISDWRFTWQYWIGEFAGGIAGGGLQVFLLNREFYNSIGIKALKRLSENRHPNPFWIFPFNKLDMRAKIYISFDQIFAKEAKKSFSSYYKCFHGYKHKRVLDLVNAYSEYLDAIDRVFDRSLNDEENCQRLIRILQRCQGINDSESVSSVFLCQFDEAFTPHITIWASFKAIFGF